MQLCKGALKVIHPVCVLIQAPKLYYVAASPGGLAF